MSAQELIARLILGSDEIEPAGWLLSAIGKACLTLAETVLREAGYPKREEVRDRLVQLQGVLAQALPKIQDFDLQNVLLETGLEPSSLNRMYQAICKYSNAVSVALTKYPLRPGSDKTFPTSEGLSPRENCALWISIIWQHQNGQPPPFTNQNAQSACETLWVAAGGDTKGRHSRESTARWRDHFRVASGSLDTKEATFIRRSLAIG